MLSLLDRSVTSVVSGPWASELLVPRHYVWTESHHCPVPRRLLIYEYLPVHYLCFHLSIGLGWFFFFSSENG